MNIDRLDTLEYRVPHYNLIHSVDVADQSGDITEPVSLTEAKNYLRLEGFSGSDSGVLPEDPINLTILEDATTVQDSRLIGMSVLSLTRDGTGYAQSSVVGNLLFTFSTTTGVVTFQNAGNPGGEPIVILYGNPNDDPDSNFDFDDTLIEELITAARIKVEVATGQHLVEKTLIVTVTNGAGNIELPGPVTGTITGVDENEEDYEEDDIKIVGSKFPSLRLPIARNGVFTYEAGYTAANIPKGLKMAILAYIAFFYEHRGDELENQVCYQAINHYSPYKKASAYA